MIYFISDCHLGYYDRKIDKLREDLLISLLSKIEKDCDTLVLLGDLFDFWFEYKTVIPKYFYRTLTALKSMREKDIKIEYIIGNHDFGHNNFFRNELDISLYLEDIEREYYGKKFYLSHGDGKTNKDALYLVLKSVLRNKLAQRLYAYLHPDIGISLASNSSKKSRIYTDNKSYGNIEGMEHFAIKKIDEGFDYVVMGHRHKIIELKHNSGYYINPGDWLNKPSFARFDGNKMDILFVEDFLKTNPL